MALWQNYYVPQTVDEALALLQAHAGNARIIAGGTDLLIDLQHGGNHALEPLAALVDVTHVAEMTHIEQRSDGLFVGGAVTHSAIVKSTLLEKMATCLVESCGVVGGPQVRNVGTLGGNVAHALPAGDGTTSLMALDAQVDVAWHDGRREWLPIAQIFKGAGVSALDSARDVLVGFRFKPLRAGEGCAFKRIMRPQGVALPVLGCAVWIRLDVTGEHCDDVRVSIAPIAPVPTRVDVIEDVLRGQIINDETLSAAVAAAYEKIAPRASKYRATAEYRSYMIETLLRRALPLAVERARTGEAKAEGLGLG